MKNIAIALLINLLLISQLLAQPCDKKNISTHPRQAVNTENPDKQNTFDWTASHYRIYWNYNNDSIIYSPYQNTAGTLFGYLEPDMPADGWELITRDLGFDDKGEKRPSLGNPFVIIYNKYTGTLRVFIAITHLFTGYRQAKIALSFIDGYSALISQDSALAYPMSHVPKLMYQNVQPFNERDRAKWFMADFSLAYDPCTCLYESRLLIEVTLLTASSEYLYKTIIFNNPGAQYQIAREWYPYYNEVLGVMNLMEMPILNSKTTIESEPDKYRRLNMDFRFPDPLNYVINPAAQVHNIETALVIASSSYPLQNISDITQWQYEGFDSQTKKYIYASPYTSLDCLNQTIFSLHSDNLPGHRNWQLAQPIRLRIRATLPEKVGSTEKRYWVAQYPVKVKKVAELGQPGDCAPVAPQKDVTAFCNSEEYKKMTWLRLENPGEGQQQQVSISAYPNPGAGVFTFAYQLPQAGIVSLTISNEMGQIVKQIYKDKQQAAGSYELAADLSFLPPGVYFYTLQTMQRRQTKRLVIIR